MSQEIYKRHRPTNLKEVTGQDKAVGILTKMIEFKKIPHAILFTGPSGVGKTTLARILKDALNCADTDFCELNCADVTGIENVREIRARMGLAPMGGDSRVWLIDEAHRLSGAAQNAMLKMLEDTPEHVYFILATTNPEKIIGTIKTRCTKISLDPLGAGKLGGLVKRIARKENFKITEDVQDKIVECADGSARAALVYLDQIIDLDSEEEQLEVVQPAATQAAAIDLFKAMINPRASWADTAKVLKTVTKEEVEGIRWLLLACGKGLMLSGGKNANRGFCIVDTFKDNFFDSGVAGLAWGCWDVIKGRK